MVLYQVGFIIKKELHTLNALTGATLLTNVLVVFINLE